jgi:hypothetical protein
MLKYSLDQDLDRKSVVTARDPRAADFNRRGYGDLWFRCPKWCPEEIASCARTHIMVRDRINCGKSTSNSTLKRTDRRSLCPRLVSRVPINNDEPRGWRMDVCGYLYPWSSTPSLSISSVCRYDTEAPLFRCWYSASAGGRQANDE